MPTPVGPTNTIFSALGDELESSEGADLPRVDAGLALEREGLEGLLGEPSALDAPGERRFLIRLPLRAEQARDELLGGQFPI